MKSEASFQRHPTCAPSPAALHKGLSRRFVLAAAGASALSACAPMQTAQPLEAQSGMNELALASLRTTQGMSSSLSPAPKSASMGVWFERAPLPVPRTEMSFVAVWDNKMYAVGGYDHRGGFAGTWNHRFDPTTNQWTILAPVPKGGNHMGLVALDGALYTFGGFTNQNNTPFDECFKYDIAKNEWSPIAKLPAKLGAISCVVVRGKIHLLGGRDTVSIGQHLVYDPKTDKYETKTPIPGARDHHAVVAVDDFIHVIGGRFNTFEFNTATHLVYSPNTNAWKERAPMPTTRSGHGAVYYRGRIVCIGGEGVVVYSQVESYDPRTNTWESHTPMATPRHGVGAAVLGDAIYVAGGGPVVGGSLLTATHEAFTMDTGLPARMGAKAL
jgi:N-acetylneuraminic acid mutarotase